MPFDKLPSAEFILSVVEVLGIFVRTIASLRLHFA